MDSDTLEHAGEAMITPRRLPRCPCCNVAVRTWGLVSISKRNTISKASWKRFTHCWPRFNQGSNIQAMIDYLIALPLDLLWVFGFRQTAFRIALWRRDRAIRRLGLAIGRFGATAREATIAINNLATAFRASGLSVEEAKRPLAR